MIEWKTGKKIPDVSEIQPLVDFTKNKHPQKPHPSLIADKSFEAKTKLIELLNSEVKNKSLLVSELHDSLELMKKKIISLENAFKLVEQENILLTIKNHYVKEQLDLLTKSSS